MAARAVDAGEGGHHGRPVLGHRQHLAQPLRHPEPPRSHRECLGLVHGLPDVDGHQARWLVPRHPRRFRPVDRVPRHRHRRCAHGPGEAGRRPVGRRGDAQRGRPLRPDQHRHRRRLRHRGGVPPAVRSGRRARRQRHRRHRSRAYRQGRRLPSGRDEGAATTPGSTTWSRSHAGTGTCCRRCRAGQDSVNLTATARPADAGRLHPRAAAAHHLLRARRQGDELERHRPGHAARTAWTRRWVYLHYFKDGQPSINWLDPTFAGMRLVVGDALHSLADLGTSALRLDANGFLGVEKSAEDAPGLVRGAPALGRRQPGHRRAWSASSAASPSRS